MKVTSVCKLAVLIAVGVVGVAAAAFAVQYNCDWCDEGPFTSCNPFPNCEQNDGHWFGSGGLHNRSCEGPDGCHEAPVSGQCSVHGICPVVPDPEMEELSDAAAQDDVESLRRLIMARPNAIEVVFNSGAALLRVNVNDCVTRRELRLGELAAKALREG